MGSVGYTSDESFLNVPLQYIRFRDGILIERFSVSRVQTAFHLDRVLSGEASEPPDRYEGFAVPTRQDCDKDGAEEFLANLDSPSRWLEAHGLSGELVRLEEATLDRVVGEALDHRIVHFSTHGWFPLGAKSPFHDSYLLLAGSDGLPDMERVARGEHEGRLTPNAILDSRLDLEGSHVSMMACVSGLAKEGIGGDALGLDWALIQAGASSLVSTHWKVSAACAARFFALFYEKWLEEGRPRATAFRETTLELLSGVHTPEDLRRWTAFSLTGDFR